MAKVQLLLLTMKVQLSKQYKKPHQKPFGVLTFKDDLDKINHSKYSGLYVYNGLMTIDGNATTIHHNCTGGMGGEHGLHADWYDDSIHLATSCGF